MRGYLRDNPYKIDVASCAKIIEEYKPELIILGRSAMLNKEPVAEIRSIINELNYRRRFSIECQLS